MPLFEFIFGGGRLILSLLPQRYSSFQNASLRIYIWWHSFNSTSVFSKYQSFQNASLKIYIWRWSFNLISFASKCLSILP